MTEETGPIAQPGAMREAEVQAGKQADTDEAIVAMTGEVATDAPTGGAMSSNSREELSLFISASVLPQTGRVYDAHWAAWTEFIKTETGSTDPYLTSATEEDKAALISLMMLRRYQTGKRGKGATSFSAAVRHRFAQAMHSTAFLDSAIITTARTSCLMKPAELRAKKDKGPSDSVK